jgi:hypothetical protein
MDDDIKFRLTNIESLLNKIFKILEGNGDQGLITRVALNSQTIDNLPTPSKLKWAAGIGGGAVTIIGLVFFLIAHSIKGLWGG